MGFWSTVGSIVGDIVPGGAGDIIKKVGEGVDLAGQIITNSGARSSQNRSVSDAQNLVRSGQQTNKDTLAFQAHEAQQKDEVAAQAAAIDAQKAQDEARVAANKAAVRGALQKHIQDVTFNRGGLSSNVPDMSFSGGLRPSAFGPELATAGTSLNASGQSELDHPPTYPTVSTPKEYQQTQPDVPAASDETIWEKMAGPLGLGLTLVGESAKNSGRPSAPTITPNAPGTGNNNMTGATISDADLLKFLAAHAPQGTPLNVPERGLGTGVTFGTPVLTSPTLGTGVTFGGG